MALCCEFLRNWSVKQADSMMKGEGLTCRVPNFNYKDGKEDEVEDFLLIFLKATLISRTGADVEKHSDGQYDGWVWEGS